MEKLDIDMNYITEISQKAFPNGVINEAEYVKLIQMVEGERPNLSTFLQKCALHIISLHGPTFGVIMADSFIRGILFVVAALDHAAEVNEDQPVPKDTDDVWGEFLGGLFK